MRLPRLRILGPAAGILLNTLLTWTKDLVGIPISVLFFAWGLLFGIVGTVVVYALVEEPPARTKKTYRIPVGSVVVRYHMRIARGMDDPIPQQAGVLCAEHGVNMDYTLDPSFWYCHLCKNRAPIGIEVTARVLALQKWRDKAPSDE